MKKVFSFLLFITIIIALAPNLLAGRFPFPPPPPPPPPSSPPVVVPAPEPPPPPVVVPYPAPVVPVPRRVYRYSPALVVKVQEALIARGYDPGPVDGIYGYRTRLAVRAFQRDNGLPVTGYLNRPTLDLLGIP